MQSSTIFSQNADQTQFALRQKTIRFRVLHRIHTVCMSTQIENCFGENFHMVFFFPMQQIVQCFNVELDQLELRFRQQTVLQLEFLGFVLVFLQQQQQQQKWIENRKTNDKYYLLKLVSAVLFMNNKHAHALDIYVHISGIGYLIINQKAIK